MSKHQLSYIVFGIILIVLVIGALSYQWSVFYFILTLIVWGILIIFGSFHIRLNYHLKAINSFKTNKKWIAITFDDGPSEYTPEVLKLLKKHKVKATFFTIGKQLKSFPKIAQQMANERHNIGNHTYSHEKSNGFKNTKTLVEEIENANQAIEAITGEKNRLFRPPFGVTNPNIRRAVKQTKQIVIGWNIRSLDTVTHSEEKIFKRIKHKIRPGSILLLHDTSQKSVNVLERLLVYLNANDYHCITISEILNLKNE